MMKKKRIAGGLVLGLLWGAAPVPAEILYRVTALGTLGGTGSSASGINDAGQVVGGATISAYNSRAFLYRDGQMTDLGTLGGSYSYAYAINSAGQVVGQANTSAGSYISHAFL